jgi:hypothetical protein
VTILRTNQIFHSYQTAKPSQMQDLNSTFEKLMISMKTEISQVEKEKIDWEEQKKLMTKHLLDDDVCL